MTEAHKIELFQDLLLGGPASERVAFREALINAASKPWRHSEKSEIEMSSQSSDEGNIIVFEREQGDNIDAVGLVLWWREEGFEVTNIVPRDIRELGTHRYNLALQDFVERVARPVAASTGFTIDLTATEQGLDDWLPQEAADALRRFSGAANKSTGSSHPSDRRRWFAFLMAAHEKPHSFDTDKLIRWLTEAEGWPEEIAHKLAIQYEFAMDLLEEYDQYRS